MERIIQAQLTDNKAEELQKEIKDGKKKEVTCDSDGILRLGRRIFVPSVDNLRREILEEAHCSAYAMHPGSTKMYRTLKEHYW